MIWILWLLFIRFDAYFNHLRELKGRINHWINVLYRSAVGVLFVWQFHLIGLKLLMFLLGGFFSFWLLFNLILNGLDERPFDYLGKTSLMDRLEATNQTFIFWCKIVLSFGFIYGYYNTELL